VEKKKQIDQQFSITFASLEEGTRGGERRPASRRVGRNKYIAKKNHIFWLRKNRTII
jgi:hypothetical protein